MRWFALVTTVNTTKSQKKISQDEQIPFWVFEEGYFRPDYVTLEKQGVMRFLLFLAKPISILNKLRFTRTSYTTLN